MPSRGYNVKAKPLDSLERQAKDIFKTLNLDSSVTQKRSISSLTASPQRRTLRSHDGYEPLSRISSRTGDREVVKRRKVVTFYEPLDRAGKYEISEDENEGVDESEEILNRKMREKEASKRRNSVKIEARSPQSLDPTTTILELKYEIRDMQLESVRKFKEIQEQIAKQSQLILDLQQENRALRDALLRPSRMSR